MDDPVDRRRLALHDALVERGFVRVPGAGADLYTGGLNLQHERVPVSVLISDLDFVSLPTIVIDRTWSAPKRRLPHVVGPGGILCYYAQGSVILDRYEPARTIVQCIERAEKVMRDALAGRLDRDFAEEFATYWGESWMLYDLPAGFTGWGEIRYVKLGNSDERTPVLTSGSSWTYERARDAGRSTREPALVVAIDGALTVNPDMTWPPVNLGQLKEWLAWADPTLVGALSGCLTKGSSPEGNLAVRAANGLFAVRVEVPEGLRKPEFLTNRRARLPQNLDVVAASVKIERVRGDAADLEYIYRRNLGVRQGLAGKSVLLMGCGTIGGFLAQQLAQCGAGTEGGRLVLLDKEKLQTANLGRHLLGVPFLHWNKAKGCSYLLNWMLPGANVEFEESDALSFSEIGRFDLIIDATGEEALSLALNQRLIDNRPAGPPHVFVWLMGNGALAQTIIVDDHADRACLKCLKPHLAGDPRFRSLKPGVEVEIGSIATCSDAEYLPFPVSRSVAAAALACEVILDWANGMAGHRFRSQTIDPSSAYEIANSSPSRHRECPACMSRH